VLHGRLHGGLRGTASSHFGSSSALAQQTLLMGSTGLATLLRDRCPCGRRCFPEGGLLCRQCVSSAGYANCLRCLARHTLFNGLPASVATAVVEFAADSAAHQFYIAILEYILLADTSPFRSFRFTTNGMAGNISETECVLDRIITFL
jgi:hypothetical protein